MSETRKSIDFVESVIDQMVESNLEASDAVAEILGEDQLPDVIEVDMDAMLESEGGFVCPACGSDDIEECVIESEGDEFYALHCQNCDTGFVPEGDEMDESEEGDVYEAEVDEDNPACPSCGSDDLTGEVVEDEDGTEVQVVLCNGCGAGLVPVE